MPCATRGCNVTLHFDTDEVRLPGLADTLETVADIAGYRSDVHGFSSSLQINKTSVDTRHLAAFAGAKGVVVVERIASASESGGPAGEGDEGEEEDYGDDDQFALFDGATPAQMKADVAELGLSKALTKKLREHGMPTVGAIKARLGDVGKLDELDGVTVNDAVKIHGAVEAFLAASDGATGENPLASIPA